MKLTFPVEKCLSKAEPTVEMQRFFQEVLSFFHPELLVEPSRHMWEEMLLSIPVHRQKISLLTALLMLC